MGGPVLEPPTAWKPWPQLPSRRAAGKANRPHPSVKANVTMYPLAYPHVTSGRQVRRRKKLPQKVALAGQSPLTLGPLPFPGVHWGQTLETKGQEASTA